MASAVGIVGIGHGRRRCVGEFVERGTGDHLVTGLAEGVGVARVGGLEHAERTPGARRGNRLDDGLRPGSDDDRVRIVDMPGTGRDRAQGEIVARIGQGLPEPRRQGGNRIGTRIDAGRQIEPGVLGPAEAHLGGQQVTPVQRKGQ